MNKNLLALAALAALAGCATPPPPATIATEDLNVGIAKTCSATPVDLAAPNPAATITMTNDGWCAVRVKQADGQPFQLGLVRTRPADGHVLVRKLGGETRIEYTADNRFVGTDKFSVALRSTTANAPDVLIQVTANVTMGENMAAPAPESKPAASTPARRATSNRSRK